jgi:integrase
VRPLELHCARHTYASRTLAAGKSVRWVAELGHANPELTLRTYAHVLPDREDLAFADFVSVSDAPGRPLSPTRLRKARALSV